MFRKVCKVLCTTVITAAVLSASIATASACTGLRLMAQDQGAVYGRTMEWGAFDLNSRVTIIPRGYPFTGTTPDGKPGVKWRAKYGVVGLDMLEKTTLADGMNEQGLAAGLFYHPGFADYPDYDPRRASRTITAIDMVHFILTQYATLDEVRQGLSNIDVVAVVEEAIGIPVEAHFMVVEPSGKALVIEFIDGKLTLFDNPLGVITNAPTFDWHMTNLRNYVNLSAVAIPTKNIEELNFAALGAGSGMIGLPGDFTPPSRFIRATAFSQTARSTATTTETVYELFRILDNFNLGLGVAEGSELAQKTNALRSSTLWTSGWDTDNRVMYYHTQHNRRVRKLDLNQVDFSQPNELRHLPLDTVKQQDTLDLAPALAAR